MRGGPKVDTIDEYLAGLDPDARAVLESLRKTIRSAAPPSVELSEMLNSARALPDVDPVLDLDAQQCLEQLQSELDRLSPKLRATFLLHRRDGLSLDEIAERLGTSLPMVKKNLMQALVQWRQRLERG